MHCPNCGTETSPEHQFCRACGLGLEKIARALAEQLRTEPGVISPDAAQGLIERQRRVERWLGTATLCFVSLVAVSVVFAIIFGLIIGKGEVLKGLLLLFIVLAAFSALALVIYNESLKDRLAQPGRREPKSDPKADQKAETARLLPESRLRPAQSVTERTTELLAVERESSRRDS